MEADQFCLGYDPQGRQRYIHDIQIIYLGYMPTKDLTQVKDKAFTVHTAKAYRETEV